MVYFNENEVKYIDFKKKIEIKKWQSNEKYYNLFVVFLKKKSNKKISH